MNNEQIDELIDEVLKEEQPLPNGLSERLEHYIDSLTETEKKDSKTVSLRGKHFLYWVSGVAAAIILGVAIFFQIEANNNPEPLIADTFTDPEEAAIAAHKALAFMSVQLNQGLDQVSEAQKEIEKVNEMINKPFK